MLTIKVCKSFGHALGEYLRQADYYSEGMKVTGECFGQLCPQVGLSAGETISDEAFARVGDNRHAVSEAKLTARMAAGRRAGYDAVFNAPKSISIQAFLGGDARLVAAHEKAVKEALGELESVAAHQQGHGINKRYVPSGAIAAAIFRHGESRALDPHLHSHVFIFNVTRDSGDGKRLLALESSPVFERTKYLTEVYRNALAREVQSIGYAIERRPHGFELAGISQELLDRFSKRAKERDRAIAQREAELKRSLSRDEIAVLVRESRDAKQYQLSPSEVRERQMNQISPREHGNLVALKYAASADCRRGEEGLNEAVRRASEHVFERKTVAPIHQLAGEVIRQSYGSHSLASIKATIVDPKSGFLHSEDNVSTQAALDLERVLVEKLNLGIRSEGSSLGGGYEVATANLDREQRKALTALLESTDRVVVLRGRAGTGKTHALSVAIKGITDIGRQVACFAPSTQAVEVLKKDGFIQLERGNPAAGHALTQSDTVQRLLVDPAAQVSIERKVVIVDEYGLLSTRQLGKLVDVVESRQARLVLVGDSNQHKSVEAGDAARIVETQSAVRICELRDVKRQTDKLYKAAAEDLAAHRIAKGVEKLQKMGAIVEIDDPLKRRIRMVEEWHAAVSESVRANAADAPASRAPSALMIAPTWTEIDALNLHARQKLRSTGQLTGEDREFVALRAKDWTEAEQKDIRNYQPGDVLVAVKATKNFVKGEELMVKRKVKGRLVVARQNGQESSLSPRQSGLAWTACDTTRLAVAAGDQLRLRAIGTVQRPDGRVDQLANGSRVVVKTVNLEGRVVLADDSILLSRQAVHGYAMTSHSAQGMTVDKVFIAGASSREGLYVSATRARQAVRIFVPDRELFVSAVASKSEARQSALEFEAQRARADRILRNRTGGAFRHVVKFREHAVQENQRRVAAEKHQSVGYERRSRRHSLSPDLAQSQKQSQGFRA